MCSIYSPLSSSFSLGFKSCKGEEEVRESVKSLVLMQAKISPKRSVASTTYFSCVSSSSKEKAWCADFGGHYFVAWSRSRKWILPPSLGGILGLTQVALQG
ncbi:hypothetical protein Pyn_07975 [Prunus yedoensis var. nudiflora]|uniref:Uncharacterized protein n=1 Tax=Prunus yedoensis var. nudiflora TaxID=2094558 RepID=A0A314UUW6_PRUYE|nr:hypothetical protein Pyn_07975 [Prunus yedoensis var. nudiflora]